MDKYILGLKIKSLRSEYSLKTGKKFTQNDLAEALGISRSYVGDIESGRTAPSDDVLSKLTSFFNIKLELLLSNNTSDINNKYEPVEFSTPEAAMQFLLKQPAIMGYGGFDINNMTNEEIIEFANELLRQIELISYKYKK